MVIWYIYDVNNYNSVRLLLESGTSQFRSQYAHEGHRGKTSMSQNQNI